MGSPVILLAGEGCVVAEFCLLLGVYLRSPLTISALGALEFCFLKSVSNLLLAACDRARCVFLLGAALERCWRRRLWRLQGDVVVFL